MIFYTNKRLILCTSLFRNDVLSEIAARIIFTLEITWNPLATNISQHYKLDFELGFEREFYRVVANPTLLLSVCFISRAVLISNRTGFLYSA